MNSKRIISLILSIIMTLQVFVFQTPVHAMEGVNPTTQKSEGQKIGKRSEVFEFKNNEKPKLSWFNTRSRSLFGARDVGLTKSEKVEIKTTATGLDDGTFNWEAFGQNKKFQAWIEVAYVGEKDEKNTPIRHRVSDVFDISKVGTINTNIVVDASKTVDNYYIVTEYDNEPDSFKINAFFERPTVTSDKAKKSLTFELGVHQIVSTKITYNLIDEYGKAIDLKDAKEEKPEDKDLKGIGKIGDVISFNLKNEGEENLWQTEMQKEEPGFDEWDLTSSSLALTLTIPQITSGGIDYKLSSTYDVINGGKVTIQRQKDAVTPKDPHNPGTTPEGYARINLSADALTGGPTGTFTKGDTTDTQRVVDVRAGKAYTTAQTEIDKITKPFPLTSEKKVDTGKTFDKWTPALSELGTAVAKETKNLNATYKSSDKEIIPYLPTDPVPTDDGNGLPIPTDYVTVTFKSESETKGKIKIGNKEGVTVLAKVKPGIDLSKKAEITTVPAQHYGFTQWKPVLGKAADGQTYTAYFVKSGEEIGEKDPIPDGWFKVTVSQDADSIQAGTVPTKYYPVKPGDKLAEDKFPAIADKAKDGYKDPAWYIGSDKVEKPYEVVINSSMDFVARATELESHKITKDNGLKPVDFTAYKGDEMGEDFWKKGVMLEKANENLQKLLDAAKVTDATTPARTTAEAGEKTGTLKVTFTDGSSLEVNNQKLIVIDTKVDINYDKESDKDANAPRHKDEVVKGTIDSKETLEDAKVEILDSKDNVIGITLAKADGSFVAGTRELQAGEKIKVRVTLPKAGKASEPVEKVVKLNADRLNELLKIAKAQKENFSKKQNAIIKEKLEALGTAITEAEKLVDKNGKAVGDDTAKNQDAIDNAVKALEEALKALTANIPPSISGPKTHEIFVGEDLDLKKLVDVTDGDGADDLVVEKGSNVKITAVKVDGQTETPVTDLSTIKNTVGTYKVTYTAEDKAGAKVTHVMDLTVKKRTNSAIEVTKDPTNMSYLITEKNGKAKLNLDGMTLNLVDNLGKKTKVDLTDKNVTFKVNGKEIKNGGDLTLADDVKFIEVEYKDGDNTLTAQTKGVLRVGPDYDKDGTDDRTQDFDVKNIEKLEVIKQPQLDYIAKDKSEADKVFKLNLEGMIVRMTDKAGKEKLAIVKEGKFYDYDEQTKEITQLTATPAHGIKLIPETAENVTGDNGKTVKITGPNNSEALTEPLKVFYDANKDGKLDHGKDQKTPAPSAMARNVGENPTGTTVEGMATPGAVIKITDKDGTALTTEPEKVVAGTDGKYKATIPLQADGTEIKVTAKLGEMGESDPTPTKVFDDKNDNKQPDRDEGFNIEKATDIKFVDQPDLTYLVPTKDTEVAFDGKDGKGKAIYLELSYKNGEKTESKIMTLEELMTDTENISVTPANGTKDKIGNDPANLVGKKLEVKLVKANPEAKATSTTAFDIKVDADNNGVADETETTATPTVTARNIGENPTKTTVEGKAPKGSTVTIKYTPEGGQETAKTVTANDEGKYTAEITPKLEAGKEVIVTAKDGEKKESLPVKTQVFDDKDNDGKDDKSQNFDMAKADKIEMVYDPAKMDYLVTSEDGKVKLETKGMVVKVTDKAGVEKKFTAEEIKDDKNFTVEPAEGTDLTIDANNGKPVKVTLNVANATTKEVTTSRNLSVKLDANGNGVDDEKEKLDLTKVTAIKIIKQPKLKYPITEENGKTNLDISDMIVELSDGVNKANYTAKELLEAKVGEGQAAKNAFKLKLIQANAKEAPTTTEIKSVNGIALTTANNGNKVQISKVSDANVKTETDPLQVFLDLDKDGNPDDKQTPAPTDLKALNVKDEAFTTITGKAKKGDTLKVYGEDKQEIHVDKSNITIDENGNFTIKVSKNGEALPKDSLVFVTAQADKKDESPRTPVVVKTDADGNGIADKDETTPEPKVVARNIGKDPKKTTVEIETEKNAKVTIEYTDAQNQAKKIETTADQNGKVKNEDITPALKAGTEVKVTVTDGEKKPATKTANVFDDLDGNGVDNKDEKTPMPSILSARNVKDKNAQDKIDTKVKVKALVGSTITIKDENGKVISDAVEVPADGDKKYNEVEITLTEKQNAGKKVQAIAKLGERQESDPSESIVFDDLDGDNKPDGQGKVDFTNIVEMRIASDPKTMSYAVKTETDTADLKLDGLTVYVKDKNGNSGIYQYGAKPDAQNKIVFEELKTSKDFKLELVDGQNAKVADITAGTKLTKANDANKIKVSLVKNAEKFDTTGPLNVFVDSNGNGIDDNKEKIDLTKVNKIDVISQPELNYPIKVDDNGKKNINLTKMVVAVSDGVTTANYTAQQLLDAKVGEDKAFKLELVRGTAEADPTTKNITSVNGIELTAANDGNKVQIALAANADVKTETEALQVFQDLNNDGNRDGNETAAPVNLKALNMKDDKFTTITGKAKKGEVIKVYGTDGKAMTSEPATVTVTNDDGTFTVKVANNGAALDVGTTVLVTAQADKKNESNRTPVIVQKDADGNGIADEDETTTITSVIARNIGTGTTSPKKAATFTTIEGVAEKGSTVTIKFNNGKEVTKTVKADDQTGAYKLELKGATEAENILLPAETVVKASAKFGDKKESNPTIETKVFEDLDADGKADNPTENKTERPSALAYNFKDESKTTIKGEAEPGAKVVAKVGETIVGEATANSDGKYEISATKDNAKLSKGTKVSVTATLAPKGESPAQETVVYDDLDGDGQPDTSQAFDKTKIRGLEVVASPNKMVYKNKEKLNLTGMKVKLTDQMGNMKIVEFSEFETYGIKVDPLNNIELSDKNVADGGNNGQKIKAEVKVAIGNSEKTYPGETPTALEVNKDQTAKPTDVTAANQGTDPATKVRFKADDGAAIKIYKADDTNKANLINGTPVSGTGKNAGYLIATLNTKLPEGTLIEITAQETGKTESSPEQARVIRDKNSNWEGGKTIKLSAPVISPIREKDKTVTVNVPKADDKIQTIIVEDPSGNVVTLTKDATGSTWTVKDSNPVVKVTEKDGKIEIPVEGKLPLKDRDLIKVTFKDGENPANEVFDRKAVQKASQKPTVDQVYTGEKEVKIVDPTVADPTATTIEMKVNDGAVRTVIKDNSGWKVKEDPNAVVNVVDGKVVVPLNTPAKLNDEIKVTTTNDSNVKSPEAKVTVVDKVLTQKPTIDKANKDENTVSGTAAPGAKVAVTVTPKDGQAKTFYGEADASGNYEVTTNKLVDGDKVVAKASELGKADNTSDEKTVGVDTSKLKESIDKAEEIGGKDGTNLKLDTNKVDKELKEALDEAKKVKDLGDKNDPNTDQGKVDKSKEDLDKAIAQKEADTAVDKAKNNPSDQNINDAQDKINQIPGTVDDNPIKKELQDKLDLIKIIKEAEEETKKDGYKDKPSADKTALENAIADGKENLKNNIKITESTTTIQKKLDIIRMERIQVGVKSLGVGLKTLRIQTSVPDAKVVIMIDDEVVDTITTSSYGTFSKGLRKGLKSGQKITLEASKSGYNDGIYSETVH
ncbi:Ig-like domain-containing protein [Anaerococcus lactolyticus]|uniref:Ig-like domain-containing protein n=1 Tax=Anaerococcus lactolyticus TaxID=33032 RepID=UPI00288B48E9|nr:Ig-like domain-containing protein [Anaerococcus lactolyticus]